MSAAKTVRTVLAERRHTLYRPIIQGGKIVDEAAEDSKVLVRIIADLFPGETEDQYRAYLRGMQTRGSNQSVQLVGNRTAKLQDLIVGGEGSEPHPLRIAAFNHPPLEAA